jgi:uncharacterized membrane protein
VALLPLSVFQGASVSADPLTQVVIFWFFAEWLRAATRGGASRGLREHARLIAAAYALGLMKPGYAPLALACLGLPGALGPRLAIGAAAIAAAAFPALVWAGVLRAAQEPPAMGADADAQLRFVLSHPLAFLAAAGRTVASLFVPLVAGMVGFLGHFDVEIPPAATALGLAAVAASASLERGPLGLSGRLVLVAAFVAASLAVIALAYLGWTRVGAPHIQSIQPRYFLLILPFALVLLPRIPRVSERTLAIAVTTSLALVLGVSAVAMVRTYYAF